MVTGSKVSALVRGFMLTIDPVSLAGHKFQVCLEAMGAQSPQHRRWETAGCAYSRCT